MIDQKILSPAVKKKIVSGNSMGLQVQIDDLRLKWCILGRNSKSKLQEELVAG
jgi:hypothetical protein